MFRILMNSRKTERGAIRSWLGLAVRAAPFALLSIAFLINLTIGFDPALAQAPAARPHAADPRS